MKAIVCDHCGPNGYARFRDFKEPIAGSGQMIVKTHAMGVNFPDVLQITGEYQHRPEVPFILGMEYSGVVDSVGEGVENFKVGDRVAGMTQGAFAERIVTMEQTCYSLPDEVDFETGAVLTLAGGAAYYGLTKRTTVYPGETLVVLGAAGGTGTYAVQIGKAMGARVIAVCSSNEKKNIALQSGADEVINSTMEDISVSIKELTLGRGVDILYDPVGGEAFDKTSRCMNWDGRILVVGFASGTIPNLQINWPLIKGYSLIGVHWAAAAIMEVELARSVVAELFSLYTEGKIKPIIYRKYPLEDGLTAISHMRERKVTGKILLSPH
jgi:NADPH2:quinone reductase